MSQNYRIANRNIIPRAHRQGMSAFTLIELIIVITIISVLASISVIGATSIQRSTRDDARKSQSTIVAEALEKYYTNNNEYPSVASIANQPINTVKQKLAIKDSEVLTFPTVTAGTSALVASNPTPARLTYVANTVDTNASAQCQTDVDGYCDAFALQYVKESDNDTVTINSRRNATLVIDDPGPVVLSPPTQPAVVGTQVNSSLVRFTASSASCSIGSVEYKIRYNTSSSSTASMPDWSTVNWSSTTTRDISPGSNTRFYSQSLARCVSGSETSVDSTASAVDTLDFTPAPPAGTAPSAPTVSASGASTSTLSVSWSAANGSAPISYTVRYGTSSGSYPSTASGCSNISGTSCSIGSLAAGTYYYVQVTASNAYGSAAGTSGASTQTNTPPPSGTAPNAPVVNASNASPSSVQLSWSASTVGTAPITYTVSGGGNASSCTSSGCTISGLSSSTSYTFTVTAANSYGSASGSATITTSPPSPTLSVSSGAINGYSNVDVSWSSSGFPNNTSFRPYASSGGTCTASTATSGSCTISTTTCWVNNTITVEARNTSLNTVVGTATATATGYTTVPSAPSISTNFSATRTSLTPSWGAVAGATYYQLRWKNQTTDSPIYNGGDFLTSTSLQISPLAPDNVYYIGVFASNCYAKYEGGGGTTSNGTWVNKRTNP